MIHLALLDAFAMPFDASLDGHRVDALLNIANILTLALALIALCWMAFVVWRYRKGRHTSEAGQPFCGPWLSIGITLVTIGVVDALLFFVSSRDFDATYGRLDDVLQSRDVLRVEMMARQWSWGVRYEGPDQVFGTPDDVVLENEFVLPKGRPVVVQLSSADVVHAFYMPSLRIKRDAVPGRVSSFWFEFKDQGQFELACSQHCGVHHYKMRAIAKVVSREGFGLWMREKNQEQDLYLRELGRAKAEEPSAGLNEGDWPSLPPSKEWGWPWKEPEL